MPATVKNSPSTEQKWLKNQSDRHGPCGFLQAEGEMIEIGPPALIVSEQSEGAAVRQHLVGKCRNRAARLGNKNRR